MKHTLLIVALLWALGASGQIYINSFTFGAAPAPVFNPLLDDYPNAAVAYSLRLLRTSYTGNCVQVRRAVDNTTSNIGFSGGVVDTAALKTFCAGTNCFISTWYDQSTNANHATQTINANQPQIVASGSLIYSSGRPTIQFTNTQAHFLSYANSFWTYTGNATNFFVARNENTAASQYGSVISQYATAWASIGLQMMRFPNTPTVIATDVFGPGGVVTPNLLVNTPYIACIKWENWSTHKTNGNTVILVNNTSQSLTAYGANPSSLGNISRSIGRFDTTTTVENCFLGKISEIVIYTTAFNTTDQQGASNNINSFYNIY